MTEQECPEWPDIDGVFKVRYGDMTYYLDPSVSDHRKPFENMSRYQRARLRFDLEQLLVLLDEVSP